MWDNITPESITRDILRDLAAIVDVREGSYTADLVAPAALEIYKLYQSMNAAAPQFYIDETSGPYIEKQGAWYGITRKAGARAAVRLSFTGQAGAVVPEGSAFATIGGLRFVTTASAVLPHDAPALAAEAGRAYNVEAGEISRQCISVPGVTAVKNPQAAQGGADAESDKALYERIHAHRSRPATSGNANHYMQWALELDGVGAARVVECKNGPGTVGVMLAGPSGGPVDEATVAAAAAHIEAVRPVCVAVEVTSARAFAVNVKAAVRLASGATLEQVRASLAEHLGEYLRKLTFAKYELPYNRIAYMLLDIPGVENYTLLTVNGGTGDIAIAADAVPVLGEVLVE